MIDVMPAVRHILDSITRAESDGRVLLSNTELRMSKVTAAAICDHFHTTLAVNDTENRMFGIPVVFDPSLPDGVVRHVLYPVVSHASTSDRTA